MKYLIFDKRLFLTIILIFVNLLVIVGQTADSGPIDRQKKLINMDEFEKLFESTNTGNMHIYAPRTNPSSDDYYYKGKLIPSEFNPVLPKKIRSVLGIHTHAVHTVKGPNIEQDFYILRIPLSNTSKLALYKMQKSKLKKVKDLAYFYKKGNSVLQQDAWLTDVNGDGKIDVILKKKGAKKNSTSVFLLQRNGAFKKTKSAKIDASYYKMH